MAKSKRGLGKGLDALIGQAKTVSSNAVIGDEARRKERLIDVDIDKIQRGQYQPRRHFDKQALDELASSIKEQGLLQPIVLRPVSGDQYEVIAGERRWRACQSLGMEHISAVIKDIDDESAMALALIENLQREDLNPVEEALALQRLQQEFNLSQQQVADAIGKPRSTIANILRLTSLHQDVLEFLERGDIETGHAKCLLSLDTAKQLLWARKVIEKGWTVRQLEAQLRQPQTKQNTKTEKDPNIVRLENDLADKLGAKVMLQQSGARKGRLIIHYNSLDELDGILQHIK